MNSTYRMKQFTRRSNSVIVITLGFATVMVLLATLYVFRLTKVTEDASRSETLRTEYIKKELIFKMRDAAHLRAILLLQMLYSPDSGAKSHLSDTLNALAEQFIAARDQLLAMNLKPAQRAAWARANPLTKVGRKAQDQAATLIIAGDNKAAENLLREKVVPIQKQVMRELTSMLDFSSARVNQLLEQEKLMAPIKFRQATFLVSLTIIISLIITYLVIRNISRAESELVLAREEAQAANQHKSIFLANMSHELRTPLTAILGFSEMLIEDARNRKIDDMAADLQKVNQAGLLLLNLINAILDLSKIEAGKMELDIHEFDLNDFITDIAATISPVIAANGNSFELDCAENPGILHTDATKLRQTLLNLLGNAAKFTSNGNIRLSIKRETLNKDDWLVFRVSDDGIGMNEEQLSHLFQAFYQGDASTTRKFGGTGLGLAISKRFCDMLGGELSVTSKLNAGSTFTVKLPASIQYATPFSSDSAPNTFKAP